MNWFVWSPPLCKSAGVRVLYKLNQILNFIGDESDVGMKMHRPADIVIYPEIASHNPFNRKEFVIYGLNIPGLLGGTKEYPKESQLIGYNEKWIPEYSRAIKQPFDKKNIVTLGVLDKEYFYNDDSQNRNIDLFWVYKGAGLRKQYQFPNEKSMKELTTGWPGTRKELGDILRQTKNLFSYDKNTALLEEAYLCGVDVWVMGDDGQVQKFEPDYFHLNASISTHENDVEKVKRFKNIVMEGKGMKRRGSEFFIAIYTNACKSYCDEKFFKKVKDISEGQDCTIHIIDNSADEVYYNRLCRIIESLDFRCKVTVEHIEVSRDDRKTLFQRNVTESLEVLQEEFLKSGCEYFVTMESDVLPRANGLFDDFLEVVNKADIIGGIYYAGFHTNEDFEPDNKELVKVGHVLSGCTLYKRKVLNKLKFRWSTENIGAFPDAWMSHDAAGKFVLANYQKIKCDHISKGNGNRGHRELV